jgi:hypothetical protein
MKILYRDKTYHPLECTIWMGPVYPPLRKHTRYLHKVEKKQVRLLISRDTGLHVTMVCYMNPTEYHVPSALIFPCKNRKNELTGNTPLETSGISG